jgi:hypothetical protein
LASTQLLADLDRWQDVHEKASEPPPPDFKRRLRWASRSFAHFLAHYVIIRDGGGTKFDPWPWQRDLAKHLPRAKRVITLKARQLGCSWLAAAYALWVGLFQRGALVLLVSQTKDDAIELLDKVQFIFDALPAWLKPETWKQNTRILKFPEAHSAIVALPSTQRAGRGKTAKLVVGDEHAFHQWAEANFVALSPTVDAGGQFWIISTANGIGNTFAKLCFQATENTEWVIPDRTLGGSYAFGRRLRDAKIAQEGWLPVFLPYDVRPGRSGDWWERKKTTYPQQRLFFQEYPRDPDESWVQSGRPVFEKEYLDRHKLLCEVPLPVDQWPGKFRGWSPNELRIWELPQDGHRYFAGADVAEGLEHGDYCSLTVLNADVAGRPEEVLTLHGHWPPDVFGRLIDTVARLYPGIYGIERNNHGLTTLITCRDLGTPGLYRERPVLTKAGDVVDPGKLGWLTSSVTKPLMIDELEQALRSFHLELRDALALPELVFYQVLKDGSTGAPEGQHDDRVIRLAIAVQMLKQLPEPLGDADDDDDFGSYAARSW